MKRIIYILFLILLIIPTESKAYYDVTDLRCTNNIKSELKGLANNTAYRISKNTNSDEVTYDLIFYNLDSKLYIVSDENSYSNRITNIKPGTNISITFYASDETYCSGYKALTKTISIPYYNSFYTDSLCEGYEDYYLCSENSNITMSYEDFIKNMNSYIKSLDNKQEIVPDTITEKMTILEFISLYSMYLYIGLVVILIIIVIVVIKKIKDRKEKIL